MLKPSLALALLLAAGCAREVVIVDRGAGVVEAGRPAIDASRKLLDETVAANREAKLDLAVFDRSCEWPEVVIADQPQGRALCGTPGTSFVDIRPETLKPTIRLIDALAAYVGAVDDIVSATPEDSATALAAAYADVENLVAIGSGVAGAAKPQLLNADQLAAAKTLAGLIGDIAHTHVQAEALTRLEAQSPQVDETIARLDSDLKRWRSVVVESDLDTIDTVYGLRAREMRAKADDAAYRQFLTQWQQLKDRHAATAALPAELSRALAALKAAHADYLRIIRNRNLTAADRQAMAAATRKRLTAALAAVAGAVKLFL